MAAIMATPTSQRVSFLRFFIFNSLLLPLPNQPGMQRKLQAAEDCLSAAPRSLYYTRKHRPMQAIFFTFCPKGVRRKFALPFFLLPSIIKAR